MLNMNQVAIAYDNEPQRDCIKQSLGLEKAEWIKDTVTADVRVLGQNGYEHSENVAELEFCMAMGGTQFELIRYTSGPNWLSKAEHSGEVVGMHRPYVAHIGFHLEDADDWPPLDATAILVQEAWTKFHTNAEINRVGRRYHYRIYKISNFTFLKFIKRLTVPVAVA